MPVRWLRRSLILGMESFSDFDAFRPNEVIGGGVSTPLRPREFSAARAILPLQDGLFVLQRSFARHLETNMGTDQGVGLIIPVAFHCTLNGRDVDNSMIGIVRGRIPVHAVEQHPNTYLMLRFNSDMRHRGWMDFDAGFEFFSLRSELMQQLRAAILDMFCLASGCNDPKEFEILQRPMRETMLSCLDSALVPDGARRARSGSFDRHNRLIRQLDELADQLGSAPLYSDDLARTLGISVRTLQSATQAICGISPHRYSRVLRLWSVRKQLRNGAGRRSVKACAIAHGFWHLGEFAASYRAAFGELPSETLQRAMQETI